MTNMRFASIGSICHGTLLTNDLLMTFANELEYHVQRNSVVWSNGQQVERDKLVKLANDAREIDPDSDEAIDLLNELFEAMNLFAPAGSHFGSHEGDGADFGFWPNSQE